MLEKDFKETIVNIKNEIINTQTQILSDANGRLINLYFKLGKILNDNSKWGDKFIEKLEVELKLDFPNTKGFSARNLRRMKRFYLEYKDEEILPPAVAKLPWTHNIMLLEKIKDKEKRFFPDFCNLSRPLSTIGVNNKKGGNFHEKVFVDFFEHRAADCPAHRLRGCQQDRFQHGNGGLCRRRCGNAYGGGSRFRRYGQRRLRCGHNPAGKPEVDYHHAHQRGNRRSGCAE